MLVNENKPVHCLFILVHNARLEITRF